MKTLLEIYPLISIILVAGALWLSYIREGRETSEYQSRKSDDAKKHREELKKELWLGIQADLKPICDLRYESCRNSISSELEKGTIEFRMNATRLTQIETNVSWIKTDLGEMKKDIKKLTAETIGNHPSNGV